MMNDKDKMHPEDVRNLIIFMLLSVAIWFMYESYVLSPQKEALDKAKKARAEAIMKNPEYMEPVNVLSRDEAIKRAGDRLYFKNESVSGSISLVGGRIDDLKLSNYYETLDKEENVTLFSPAKVKNARYADYGWVARDSGLSLPGAKTRWFVQGNEILGPDAPVTLVWDNGQGLRFEREISMDDQFVFKITQRVYNRSGKEVELFPYALISQKDVPEDYTGRWVAYEGPIGFINDSLYQKSYSDMVKNPSTKIESKQGWIGISDKYWLTALIPEQGEAAKYRFKYVPDPVTKERSRYQTDYTGLGQSVQSGAMAQNTYHLYTGAKKVLVLEDYQEELGVKNLDLAVDFGWFWFFTYPFFLALHYLGLLVGNMGAAIVILTFIVRMAVFPLTNVSYKSFAKMKVVAPQITEIRKKHEDDKQKLQQEIVELYQREGVNPMSGCFPILLQIPIFFAFYKTILVTIEIRHAPFFGWIQDLSAPDPTSIFNLFGLLPYDVPAFLMIGAWPCMMLAAMLVQKKLNPPPQDKMQRQMMNIFPFFITFIMAGFASGLVVYWTVSAALSVLQQMYIMRSMDVPIYIFNKAKYQEELDEQLEKGPDVHPFTEMVEEDFEEGMFGEHEDENAPKKEESPKAIKPPKPKKSKKKKK